MTRHYKQKKNASRKSTTTSTPARRVRDETEGGETTSNVVAISPPERQIASTTASRSLDVFHGSDGQSDYSHNTPTTSTAARSLHYSTNTTRSNNSVEDQDENTPGSSRLHVPPQVPRAHDHARRILAPLQLTQHRSDLQDSDAQNQDLLAKMQEFMDQQARFNKELLETVRRKERENEQLRQKRRLPKPLTVSFFPTRIQILTCLTLSSIKIILKLRFYIDEIII